MYESTICQMNILFLLRACLRRMCDLEKIMNSWSRKITVYVEFFNHYFGHVISNIIFILIMSNKNPS